LSESTCLLNMADGNSRNIRVRAIAVRLIWLGVYIVRV
jgi:hypothetical protein